MNSPSSTNGGTDTGPLVFDRERTATLLDFHMLVDAIAEAAAEQEAGTILSPERLVVPLGEGGVLLSMPATARDIGIHKLVNVQPANRRRGLPTIHATVTVCDAATGRILCILDGPEVTGRRTAAVSMLAIRTLLRRAPARILLFGTGVQAGYHVRAIHALHPQSEILVCGRSAQSSEAFCDSHRDLHPFLGPCAAPPSDIDAVIMLTTSKEPVYDEQARPGRLVIGAGAFKPEMAELGRITLDGSDLYADDPAGARHEAGDLLRANTDWSRVRSLAAALRGPVDVNRAAVFKSVGTAAWDLAAARVALKSLASG
ncbi:delta(1)-pyrroline-2-carboxylate reductase family protein [Massilia dura]|uniref:Delta(1)-pyrroline-2-carboxylate reductase family protein n=1 Tax=Pseudoduganella dura TaxID=321982 RepID=A0A6I3XC95_9BURK|nr:bifunctional Delta(1)-pyrroline-2-carboxylate/Delta(1)-piperideine-2-carboxylate reductase [Pseudoduganella dura]MUI11733.1 delta(1)-pyrroline-2-carboxylate reductase family protein [Pseudoduganella dura]GGX78689.1 ornithine cyclodeaminase [Pseudoduganella dura]